MDDIMASTTITCNQTAKIPNVLTCSLLLAPLVTSRHLVKNPGNTKVQERGLSSLSSFFFLFSIFLLQTPMATQSSIPAIIRHPFVETFTWFYLILQAVLRYIFSPVPPPLTTGDKKDVPKRKVAVIGAGVTGISSAAHCVGHGLDVQIFESRPQDQGLGGIWSVCSPFYRMGLY